MGSESPNALDFSAASFPLTLTLSLRRGNQARSPLIVQHHSPLPRRNSILPLHEPGWGETPSNPDIFADQNIRTRRSLAPPVDGFMASIHVQIWEVFPAHEPGWGESPLEP